MAEHPGRTDEETALERSVLQRPPESGPRSIGVAYRVSPADKQEIAALAEELGWTQTDVVIAGVYALRSAKPFLLTRFETAVLERLLVEVRGAASNVNTLVRDFHTLRHAIVAARPEDAPRLEAALAELPRLLQDRVVQPIARLLGIRVPQLRLHAPRLAGHVPSTQERLRERRAVRGHHDGGARNGKGGG